MRGAKKCMNVRLLVQSALFWALVTSTHAEEGTCEGEQCPGADSVDGNDASSRGMMFLVVFALLVIVLMASSAISGGGSDDDFADFDAEMSNMVNGFKFGLPMEKDEFNEMKKTASPLPDVPLPIETAQRLKECLMRRAIADLIRAQYLSREKSGMETLYKKHLIKKSTWDSFQKAEKMIEAEMQETKTEAEELGMRNIFQAAHQQFLQLELRLATEQAVEENNLKKKKDEADKGKDDSSKKKKSAGKTSSPPVHLVKPAKDPTDDPE